MDNESIEKMEKEFVDLQEYSSSQFSVIVSLQKKIKDLEDQNRSLQGMLNGSVHNIRLNVSDIIPGISNEEMICETQINFLRQNAMQRELTKEECQKFQILSDVLERLRKTNDKSDHKTDVLQDAQILSIIDGN